MRRGLDERGGGGTENDIGARGTKRNTEISLPARGVRGARARRRDTPHKKKRTAARQKGHRDWLCWNCHQGIHPAALKYFHRLISSPLLGLVPIPAALHPFSPGLPFICPPSLLLCQSHTPSPHSIHRATALSTTREPLTLRFLSFRYPSFGERYADSRVLRRTPSV